MIKFGQYSLVAIASFLSSPAIAADVWYCSYAIDDAGNQHHRRYRVDGDEVTIVGGAARYHVLQNDEVALIAAGADSFVSPSSKALETSGSLLFIDKKTGKFLETWTMSHHLEGPFIFPGSCRKK